jgi:malonyl-CoA O-methyltransferase
MKVRQLYNEWSTTYDFDDNATRDLDKRVLAKVLRGLRFDSIVEMGCGTGKNTPLLAKTGRRVQAVDFSAGMLAQARKKPLPNVTWSLADIARRWPQQNRSAELVVCNLVLEHISNLQPVFKEAARVLKPGGLFFVSELHPFRQYGGVVAKFKRGNQTQYIPAYVHHISDFLASAKSAGFDVLELQEWWHKKDQGKPPRLVTFWFKSRANPKRS